MGYFGGVEVQSLAKQWYRFSESLLIENKLIQNRSLRSIWEKAIHVFLLLGHFVHQFDVLLPQ